VFSSCQRKLVLAFWEALIYFRHASGGWHPDPNQRGQRPQPIKSWVYEVHPWPSPFGPAFGGSNSFQTNLSAFAGTTENGVIQKVPSIDCGL
jgi:hypothetical protein